MQPYYIETPNGRVHFADIRKANNYAQTLANTSQQTVIRYDIHGGQSWFHPQLAAIRG